MLDRGSRRHSASRSATTAAGRGGVLARREQSGLDAWAGYQRIGAGPFCAHPIPVSVVSFRVPYSSTVLEVMITSPGDVASVRRIAHGVVHEWNTIHAASRRTILNPRDWETSSRPVLGERAQETINKQLVRNADILVAIFWTRLGTPTGKAESGTVEEIRETLALGRPVLVYFSEKPVELKTVDTSQWEALQKFKEELRQQGLVEAFESDEEFEKRFSRQLAQTIIDRFPPDEIHTPNRDGPTPTSSVSQRVTSPPPAPPLPDVSEEALRLLKAAATDASGGVIMTSTFGGLSVEANGQDFVSEKHNAREEAKWREVVRALVARGLLEQQDLKGEIYAISAEGFRVADFLPSPEGS
jgi:hypothetical protein